MRRAAGLAVAVVASTMLLVGAARAQAPAAPAKPGAARAAKGEPLRAASAAPAADPVAVYGPRFAALCAACHGPSGRSEMAGVPVIAGQHGFYAITQLFLFREGRRGAEAMIAVAKTLSDDDMRGYAAVIDRLPPVPPPAPATPPDAGRMAKARDLAREHKCSFCHGDDFAGGQQVPRIGGQNEDYLRDSLRAFKSGTRPGYTQAMTAAVSQVPVDDLDTLAWYAARVGSPAR